MNKVILLVFFVFSLSGMAGDISPALFVPEDPDSKDSKREALRITAFSAEVVINGHLAGTELTLTFQNSSKKDLEGTFYFPLPENSTITGYALDINGKMVDGVAVEKERGRQVFESIKKQMIDPGLLEWENGNCFKTRIYPILAKKSRTITVKYITELQENRYTLPLGFKGKIQEFKLLISVIRANVFPKVLSETFKDLKFVEMDSNSVAKFAAKDFLPDKDITIIVPRNSKDSVIVEQASNKKLYFCINTSPIILDAVQEVVPEKITIFWDASGSRAETKHYAEYQLLKDYFAKYAEKEIDVEVYLLRNVLEEPVGFNIKNEKGAKKLIDFLKAVDYDGGTQLGALQNQGKTPSFYLLFSDGISTLGKEQIGNLKAPLYMFSSGQKVNDLRMKKLAAETGGGYCNLLTEKNPLKNIGRPSFNFISTEFDSTEFSNVTPDIPEQLSDRSFVLTGEMLQYSGKIKVNFGIGKKIILTKEFSVSANSAENASLLYKYQALQKLDQLMIFPDLNISKIVKLGKKYGLVTPGTSLIVLESLHQYIQYRVPPPKSLKAMRDEYFARTNRRYKKNTRKTKELISSVVYNWTKRVMWWNTEFKYRPDFKYKSFRYRYNDDYSDDEGGFDTEATFGEMGGGEMEEGDAAGGSYGMSKAKPVRNKDVDDISDNAPKIVIKLSESEQPYLKEIREAPAEQRFNVYMQKRKSYENSPAFFLACAELFAKAGERKRAVQIISNLAELRLNDTLLLRVLACKLSHLGELDTAVEILQQAMRIAPETPGLYLDLGGIFAKLADSEKSPAKKKEYYEKAVSLFYKLITSEWVDRDTAALAVMEINHLMPESEKAGVKDFKLPAALLKMLDADLRIVITPFTNMTRMNFIITEPSGEKANIYHPLTLTGGFISGGYCAEEYFVRKAMKGRYKISIDLNSIPSLGILGAVFVQVDIYSNYGRKKQKRETKFIVLRGKVNDIVIGSIDF